MKGINPKKYSGTNSNLSYNKNDLSTEKDEGRSNQSQLSTITKNSPS